MPCLVALFALFFPRVILFIAWLVKPVWVTGPFENLFSGQFYWLLPILGWIFLPLTTLAYCWAFSSLENPGTPVGVVVILIALLLDLGLWGGSGRYGYSR
ncbi:MAG: hypothetical protein P8J86_07575 [Phycisphaerales bacterium]|nr:hypothetical protein [Phycisphaerales bacterium]